MKYLLLFSLFMNTSQGLIYHLPTHQFVIFSQNENSLQVLLIEENILLPVSCIDQKVKNLNKINFSKSSSCLMKTLNQSLNLNIQSYADMKNILTLEKAKALKNDPRIAEIILLLTKIETDISLSEFYTMFQMANKNGFRYEIHTLFYLVKDENYLPLHFN